MAAASARILMRGTFAVRDGAPSGGRARTAKERGPVPRPAPFRCMSFDYRTILKLFFLELLLPAVSVATIFAEYLPVGIFFPMVTGIVHCPGAFTPLTLPDMTLRPERRMINLIAAASSIVNETLAVLPRLTGLGLTWRPERTGA